MTSAISIQRRPGKSVIVTSHAAPVPTAQVPMATNMTRMAVVDRYCVITVPIRWRSVSAVPVSAAINTPRCGNRHNTASASALSIRLRCAIL